MNTNKKTKNKKINEAISNMGNSTSFKSLNELDNKKFQENKNIHEGLK